MCLCSVVALLVANQSVQPETAIAVPKQPTIDIGSLTSNDVRILRIEREKGQVLAELEPALRRQADLQVVSCQILAMACHIITCEPQYLSLSFEFR